MDIILEFVGLDMHTFEALIIVTLACIASTAVAYFAAVFTKNK